MSTLATLVVKLVGEVGEFASAMKGAEKTAATSGSNIAAALGKGISTVGKIAAGAAVAGIGAATAAMVGSLAATTNWANKLDDLGDVLGTTADESAAILTALKPFGSAGEDITSQMGRLVMGLTDAKGNLGESGKMMEKLGIQFRDAATGKILPATKIMENIANVVGNMPDGLEKTGIMMDLFGKSGRGMSDALGAMANGGLEEARKKAEAFGLTIGDDGVASAINLTKGMADLELAGQGLAVTIGGPLLAAIVPIVEKLAMWAVEVMPKLRDGISQVTAPLGAFVTMIGALVSGLGGGGDPFGVIVNSVYNFLTAIGMAQGEAASWAVGIGSFVKDAITLFQQVVTWVQANFPIVRDAIVGAFQQVVTWVQANFPIVRDAIVGAFQQVVGIITPIINTIAGVATALIETLTSTFANAGPSIEEKLTAIWNAIKTWVSTKVAEFAPMLQEWAAGILGWIRTAVAEIPGRMVAFWEALYAEINKISQNIGEKIPQWVAAFVVWIDRDLVPWLKNEFPKIAVVLAALILALPVALIATLAVAALAIINGLVDGMKTAIENETLRIMKLAIAVIDGLIKGFNDAKQQVIDALLSILKGAVDAVKAFFGIASPSKLMAEMGYNIAAGMAQGILGGSGLVDSAMGALASASSATGAYGSMGRGASTGFPSTSSGNGSGNGMPMQAVVNVHLDGRLVESFVTDMLYTSLQGAA